MAKEDPNVDHAAIKRAEADRLRRLAQEIADKAERDRQAREAQERKDK